MVESSGTMELASLRAWTVERGEQRDASEQRRDRSSGTTTRASRRLIQGQVATAMTAAGAPASASGAADPTTVEQERR